MQQIREEHKKLEINRDILSNKLKNQYSHTINLTEFEHNTLIYAYAPKQINTRYGLSYTILGSLSDEINEQTEFLYIHKLNLISLIKIEFNNILPYGSISGFPIITKIKKYNFTSKSNHLSAFLQINGVNYNQEDGVENIQPLNKLEALLAKTKTKSCREKLDNIDNTNDILQIIGYRSLNKSLIIKLKINDELDVQYLIASFFPKKIVLNKIRNKNQFSLKVGPFKTKPQKKPSRNSLTP